MVENYHSDSQNQKHTPKILLGLTTTPGSDWHQKVQEIDQYGIREIALFPTFLDAEKRQELYSLLEKSSLGSIPHIHLRNNDHTAEEINYLIDRYGTKLFNIHPYQEAQKSFDLLSQMGLPAYIENIGSLEDDFETVVQKSAGLCVDFSHYHDHWAIEHEPTYRKFQDIIKKYEIGCGHISAIRSERVLEFNGELRHGCHSFVALSDFDYMKNYLEFLPEYTSLELENSFEEQLKAKSYLEKIISSFNERFVK